MAGIFRKLLGLILLLATIGLATCQSFLKAEPQVNPNAILNILKDSS